MHVFRAMEVNFQNSETFQIERLLRFQFLSDDLVGRFWTIICFLKRPFTVKIVFYLRSRFRGKVVPVKHAQSIKYLNFSGKCWQEES